MSPLGEMLWRQGTREIRAEVRRVTEQAALDRWVAIAGGVIAKKLAEHWPELDASLGDHARVTDAIEAFVMDTARNVVASLQPDLARDAGLPREAVGMDFETGLIR